MKRRQGRKRRAILRGSLDDVIEVENGSGRRADDRLGSGFLKALLLLWMSRTRLLLIRSLISFLRMLRFQRERMMMRMLLHATDKNVRMLLMMMLMMMLMMRLLLLLMLLLLLLKLLMMRCGINGITEQIAEFRAGVNRRRRRRR